MSEVRVQYSFASQKGHMSNLIESEDQAVQHESLSLGPEEEVPHLPLADPDSPHQWFVHALFEMFLDLGHAFIDHAMHMRGASQRVGILNHPHLWLFDLESWKGYIGIQLHQLVNGSSVVAFSFVILLGVHHRQEGQSSSVQTHQRKSDHIFTFLEE